MASRLLGRIVALARSSMGVAAPEPAANQTVVVCPTHQMPASVELDPNDQMIACSRRAPESSCPEDCAQQVQYAAESLEQFLVRTAGQNCEACGKAIGAEDWYASRLSAEKSGAVPSAAALTRITCFACR